MTPCATRTVSASGPTSPVVTAVARRCPGGPTRPMPDSAWVIPGCPYPIRISCGRWRARRPIPIPDCREIRRFLRWRAHEPLLCEGGAAFFAMRPRRFSPSSARTGPMPTAQGFWGCFISARRRKGSRPAWSASSDGENPSQTPCPTPSSRGMRWYSGRSVSRSCVCEGVRPRRQPDAKRRATAASRAGLPPIGETVRAMRDALVPGESFARFWRTSPASAPEGREIDIDRPGFPGITRLGAGNRRRDVHRFAHDTPQQLRHLRIDQAPQATRQAGSVRRPHPDLGEHGPAGISRWLDQRRMETIGHRQNLCGHAQSAKAVHDRIALPLLDRKERCFAAIRFPQGGSHQQARRPSPGSPLRPARRPAGPGGQSPSSMAGWRAIRVSASS